MMYCTIALYLLGFYMTLHLSQRIFRLEGEQHEVLPALIACSLWPLVSAYYLVRRMLVA